MKTSLSVVVPVYNEQYLVTESLRRLLILGESPLLDRIQILVVDDGSSDRTPQVLEEFQKKLEAGGTPAVPGPKIEWKFFRQPQNFGKGAAVRLGIEHAACELTVIHDADLEYHPRDLLKMIPLFLEEDADAVYGSRFLAADFRRVLFFRHEIGNQLLTFFCNLASDLNLTDIETCYKMVRTGLLKSIPLESADFRMEPEITIKLAKRGARVFEVPISYSGRTYQEGKKINWQDGILALAAMIEYTFSDRIYKEDEFGSQILGRLNRAPRFNRWMADTVRPYLGQRVLEIGAGTGNMTLLLAPRDLYWATDLNPLYLNHLERLAKTRPYMRTALLDVARQETFPHEKFDTVVAMNVIEHIQDDVQAVKNIAQVLAEGGRALILVPQSPSLYGTLDEVLGHCRRYTREDLENLGRQAGLQTVEILDFNRAGVPAWWLNGQVFRRKTFGLMQIKMLNLLTPLFKATDGVWPLRGLSLIGVFEKHR